MTSENNATFEQALALLDRNVESMQKLAAAMGRAIKLLQKAAKEGEVRKLNGAFTAAAQAIQALDRQFASTRDGWGFDIDEYFASGAFAGELMEAARKEGVRIFEQDDRLFCYPSLVRVLPAFQSVQVDKKRDARVRPSVLARLLKDNQQRQPRFKPEPFLESLYEAYQKLDGAQKSKRLQSGRVVRLLDMYNLFTILPGQTREYTQLEFTRDIYLLDGSGVTRTKKGAVVSFPASTGTKSLTGTLSIVTQTGREKTYYGIAFDAP
jgi:hypothetical protein